MLVVDDDEAIRLLAAMCLHQAGYEVVEASGDAAVRVMLPQRRFDVILVDAVMPGVSGVSVIHEARRTQPAAAIIGMSGGHPDLIGEFCRALASGPHPALLLVKPFHLDELLTAVRRACAAGDGRPEPTTGLSAVR